jgi:hypothetical protein
MRQRGIKILILIVSDDYSGQNQEKGALIKK